MSVEQQPAPGRTAAPARDPELASPARLRTVELGAAELRRDLQLAVGVIGGVILAVLAAVTLSVTQFGQKKLNGSVADPLTLAGLRREATGDYESAVQVFALLLIVAVVGTVLVSVLLLSVPDSTGLRRSALGGAGALLIVWAALQLVVRSTYLERRFGYAATVGSWWPLLLAAVSVALVLLAGRLAR